MKMGNPIPTLAPSLGSDRYICVWDDQIPPLLRQGNLSQPSQHCGKRAPPCWSVPVDEMVGRTDPGKLSVRGAEFMRKIMATPPRRGRKATV